jgi:polyphosphate kinase
MVKKTTPDKFVNREISWLAFNARVLQEAGDNRLPLIQRIRFLGIFSNNLDEFFRVRVASLRRLESLGKKQEELEEETPDQLLSEIHDMVIEQQQRFDEIFTSLMTMLEEEGIFWVKPENLDDTQAEFVSKYFNQQVRPRLVPLMLDPKLRMPELKDSEIYLAIKLSGSKSDKTRYAIIEIPSSIPRFLVLPDKIGKHFFMFIDDVIRFELQRVFNVFDYAKIEAFTIKITRDAELDIDDDISKSLIEKMSRGVDKRRKGEYVRMLFDKSIAKDLFSYLVKHLKLDDAEELIAGGRYHNRKSLMAFPDFGMRNLVLDELPPLPHPLLKGKRSVFDAIRDRDVMLYFPYHQFDYIVDLLREAAIDPNVRTIRINLYRIAHDSQIGNALINAAKNGKKVVCVVELQARFDEANNIEWSNRMQEAGVRVIFGVPGLKVHAKLLLISRKEGGKTLRYAHIGTGNFHERTARLYGDCTLLTSHSEIANEVRKVFHFFENNYQRQVFRHLVVSPFSTRRRMLNLITEEINNARKGKKAWMVLKLNNLVDKTMIRKLYDASNAGVKIDLIIRGVCSLVPGEPGMSENIAVRSIVARFLEHARVLVFANGGNPLYFISSSDWMTRNLDFRIEVTAPVYDKDIQRELWDMLQFQLNDNQKARIIDASLSNTYVPVIPGDEPLHSQRATYAYFKRKVE